MRKLLRTQLKVNATQTIPIYGIKDIQLKTSWFPVETDKVSFSSTFIT